MKHYFSGDTSNPVISFFDLNGEPITPDSAEYTLYNYFGERDVDPITEDQPIEPTGQKATLTISSEENTLIDPTADREIRLLVVNWRRDNFEITTRAKYKILNPTN